MNKIFFLGNICNDIETKTLNENTNISTFNLAVQRKFKNKDGEYETDFFKITAFNTNANFISKYFSKGRKILVECRAQNRNWEDEQGQKHYTTDFIVDNCYFADSKKDNLEGQTDFTNTVAQAGIVVNEFASADDLPF